MTDYISRADAIEMAVDVETPQGTYERAIYVDDLMALPSADAVQGEWKRVPTRTYKGECTNCGFRHIFMDGHDSQYRFCPYCGARMKGGAE